MKTASSRAVGAKPLVTIKDVALAAGVSVATVSNVVNGRKGAVGEVTRAKVQQQIERLAYRPQSTGRGLRNARFNAVSILIIDEERSYLSNPFVGSVVAGLTEALNSSGFLAVLHGSPRGSLEDAMVIKQFGVDGLCVVLSGSTKQRLSLTQRLMTLGQPLVFIQESQPLPEGDLCVVRQDDLDGGRQLGEHLIERGCRNVVAVLPSLEWPALQARVAGVRQAMARAKPKGKVKVVAAETEDFASVVKAVDRHLDAAPLPDAFVCGNDQLAIATMQTVKRRGHTVPADVRITGFNAFDFWQYTSPTITTVVSPAREIGVRAARAMIDRLESGGFAASDIVLPVQLQRGEST